MQRDHLDLNEVPPKPVGIYGDSGENSFMYPFIFIDKSMMFMPYPCNQFCADIKFDIRFDNRFDIKLGDSFYVNHTINFGTKLRSYGIV